MQQNWDSKEELKSNKTPWIWQYKKGYGISATSSHIYVRNTLLVFLRLFFEAAWSNYFLLLQLTHNVQTLPVSHLQSLPLPWRPEKTRVIYTAKHPKCVLCPREVSTIETTKRGLDVTWNLIPEHFSARVLWAGLKEESKSKQGDAE